MRLYFLILFDPSIVRLRIDDFKERNEILFEILKI